MCVTQNDGHTQGSYYPYISKLKLSYNIDDRTQLALLLWELLKTCDPGQHDVDAFKKIVDLIHKIVKEDSKRLREAHGECYVQVTEKQMLWVQCIQALIAQRETRGFGEELSIEERKQRENASRGMHRMTTKLSNWEWMTQITSSIFSGLLPDDAMESWPKDDELAFNEELLVCFGLRERQSTPPKPAKAGGLLKVIPTGEKSEM
jgi:hypothetical protein